MLTTGHIRDGGAGLDACSVTQAGSLWAFCPSALGQSGVHRRGGQPGRRASAVCGPDRGDVYRPQGHPCGQEQRSCFNVAVSPAAPGWRLDVGYQGCHVPAGATVTTLHGRCEAQTLGSQRVSPPSRGSGGSSQHKVLCEEPHVDDVGKDVEGGQVRVPRGPRPAATPPATAGTTVYVKPVRAQGPRTAQTAARAFSQAFG